MPKNRLRTDLPQQRGASLPAAVLSGVGGVDVGAKAEIHPVLDELACQCLAVLLISSELPEVMNLSGRILVMCEGELMGELEQVDASQPNLMRLMAGIEAGTIR